MQGLICIHSLSHILWCQRKIHTSTKIHILNSVILSTLPYGLESTVLLEPHVRHPDHPGCLGQGEEAPYHHAQDGKAAENISILSKSRLLFLSHLSRMPEDQLPRQLLVCSPVGGKHSAGGQKRGWNDIVASDLKQCNLSGTWREQAQEHGSWCTTIQRSVEHLNIEAENNERSCKDKKKHHHEQ